MAWILDTYLSMQPPQQRQDNFHVVTGKPVASGGSVGRDKATGQGVVFLIERWAEDNDFDLQEATYFVQGFGNVGSWASRLMKAHGAKMIAVEDASGAIYNPEGIDPDLLRTHVNAAGLDVRLVAEGANGPTTPEGDAVMIEKEVHILPDVLCNAGGVIVSYFEWLQNKRREYWDLDEVDGKLHKILMAGYRRVKDTAAEFDIDWRTAAYIVALRRLERVYKERGIFP
jgi:glutamate dehydrogenase (NAD(P)+)